MAATVLGRWVQHCVPKLCKTGKYLSLMDIMHSLMLFSAPIFWGFFGFFYHKKVSQYYIINLRKSFSLSLLFFPFWEFFSFSFFIPTTMITGPEPSRLKPTTYVAGILRELFIIQL